MKLKVQRDILDQLKPRKGKPRWILRIPTRDKRGPFIYMEGQPIPGNGAKQVNETTFTLLRKKNKIVLHSVSNSGFYYKDYVYKERRIRVRLKPKKRKRTRRRRCIRLKLS